MKTHSSNFFIIGSIIVVFVAVCIGLAIIGSPQEARKYRFDMQRIHDFKAIVEAIEHYSQNHKPPLPSTIETLIQAN